MERIVGERGNILTITHWTCLRNDDQRSYTNYLLSLYGSYMQYVHFALGVELKYDDVQIAVLWVK